MNLKPNTNSNEQDDAKSEFDLNWEIEQYLLSDDRVTGWGSEAFEKRMLDDPEFALQVAKAVHDLQVIESAVVDGSKAENVSPMCVASSAASDSRIVEVSSKRAIFGGWWASLVPATAAALLIAATLAWQQFSTQTQAESEMALAESLPEVASGWIALLADFESDSDDGRSTEADPVGGNDVKRSLSLENGWSAVSEWDVTDGLSSTSVVPAVDEMNEADDDWLLEAATVFLEDSQSSSSSS